MREKGFFTESCGGANKGLGEAPKSCTRKEHESATNSIAKGVKGQLPLAGSRDSVPCGVWGNAPTVPRATSMPNALNKGAGSEASLPVTLRVRRRAPKLLFPTSVLCRAKWARPCSWSYNQSCSFAQAGVSRLWARPKGNENRRSLRSPFETFGSPLPELTFVVAGGNRACGRVNPAIIALLWDGNPRRWMQKSPEL